MATLVKLSPEQHGDLKVRDEAMIETAKTQHLINLKAVEVSRAASDFPIFMTKLTGSAEWALSAVSGLEMNTNLFVNQGKWDALYQPSIIQTYPIYLMESAEDEKGYALGIQPDNDAFSRTQGKALFENGSESVYLSQIKTQLEADIASEMQTRQFVRFLVEQELVSALDLLVQYEGGRVNTLKGLHSISEDRLNALDGETLAEMRNRGYLAAVYSMLISLFQLNRLILKNNALNGANRILQVKMEVAKNPT